MYAIDEKQRCPLCGKKLTIIKIYTKNRKDVILGLECLKCQKKFFKTQNFNKLKKLAKAYGRNLKSNVVSYHDRITNYKQTKKKTNIYDLGVKRYVLLEQ